jgi:hypothetical protein
MVAAGMVSAASIVGVPEHQGIPVVTADVANASALTDFLYGIGDAVNSASYGLSLSLAAPIRLPFDALAAIAVATQAPESVRPALLSWLVQKYVNPAPSPTPIPIPGFDNELFTYPEAFLNGAAIPLAELLPAWLGPRIVYGLNQISAAINAAFDGAANPLIGQAGADEFYASDIGRVVLAANQAIAAPAWALYDTAYYLGYLPADLEATFESAIRNPSDIPGLVSNLAWDLMSSYGLVGSLLYTFTAPLMTLPGPIGELATNFYNTVTDGLDNALSLLPDRVPLNPFPTPDPEEESQINSLPDTSLQRGISLLSTDVVEEVEEKVEAPAESTGEAPPVAPQDPAPAAGDVDPGAPPAADTDTDTPEVKPGKPVTTKKGNKVRPGDKFTGPAKGDTGKDDDTTAPANDGPVSAPAGPAGPEGGDADGADNAGGAEGDSGAAA